MKNFLILILMLVSHTANGQDVEYQPIETPNARKSDGVTNYHSLTPQPKSGNQYKSNGWGGAGTLSSRGIVDEWEEHTPKIQ